MTASRMVLGLFLLAQACDGIFTYVAVRSDGIAAEGNMLLATWMTLVGPAPTLLGAKMLAAACGVLLYARRPPHPHGTDDLLRDRRDRSLDSDLGGL
jgi:hypothetical protein